MPTQLSIRFPSIELEVFGVAHPLTTAGARHLTLRLSDAEAQTLRMLLDLLQNAKHGARAADRPART